MEGDVVGVSEVKKKEMCRVAFLYKQRMGLDETKTLRKDMKLFKSLDKTSSTTHKQLIMFTSDMSKKGTLVAMMNWSLG